VSDDAGVLLDGGLAILPTDTVYGIGTAAESVAGCAELYRVKQRPASQPVAVIAGSVEGLLSAVLPELDGRSAAAVRALLPGPLTLVVPNAGRRFPHLCGDRPDAIGVRVPVLAAEVGALATAVGGLAMTSANLRGEPAPAALDEVPQELRGLCPVVVDGGRLQGAASAVIDITGPAPVVLRDGPGAEQALEEISRL
jgi:L-threonylcarbamoyladenylate synthase